MNIHPGEILQDFLDDNSITQTKFAEILGVRHAKVNLFCNGNKSVKPEFAFQLEAATGIKAQTWLNMQAHYELKKLLDKEPSRLKRDKSAIAKRAASSQRDRRSDREIATTGAEDDHSDQPNAKILAQT